MRRSISRIRSLVPRDNFFCRYFQPPPSGVLFKGSGSRGLGSGCVLPPLGTLLGCTLPPPPPHPLSSKRIGLGFCWWLRVGQEDRGFLSFCLLLDLVPFPLQLRPDPLSQRLSGIWHHQLGVLSLTAWASRASRFSERASQLIVQSSRDSTRTLYNSLLEPFFIWSEDLWVLPRTVSVGVVADFFI